MPAAAEAVQPDADRVPSTVRSSGDELSEYAKKDRKVGRALERFLRHWEVAGQPLTPDERNVLVWSLAVHSSVEQIEALDAARRQDRRRVCFGPGLRA